MTAGLTKKFNGLFGSGRFYETLVAKDYPVYLVIYEEPGFFDRGTSKVINKLKLKFVDLLKDIGEVDSLFLVDTGGDGLSFASHQDAHVIEEISQLDIAHRYSLEIAVGVDAPEGATEILKAASASYIKPSTEEARRILAQYSAYSMDGRANGPYGKTAFAWQAALKNQFRLQVLPLPEKLVVDRKNPWNPFVYTHEGM